MAHPFVKWVGGKTQLLDEIVPHVPENIEVYVEPFVGGGAVLFEVLRQNPGIQVLIINDKNDQLINAYYCITYYVERLISLLVSLSHDYIFAEDRKEFYYKQREKFNEGIEKQKEYIRKGDDANAYVPDCEQAARFIFLNKTCFNGLYRVNKNGLFNVSFNNAKSVAIDYDNLREISYELKSRITIFNSESYDNSSIRDLLEKEKNPKRVFVYLDPPYRILRPSCVAVPYTEDSFTDKDQEELKGFCDWLNNLGIKFLQSNSDPEDKYFDELYKDYNIRRVQARRNINSVATKRGKINEILISNF